MSRTFLWVLGIVVIAGVVTDGYAIRRRLDVEKEFQIQVALGRAEAERIRAQVVLPTTKKIPAGEKFAAALQELGLSEAEAAGATAAARSVCHRCAR